MTEFKYFSYGSNLLSERLQARCPSAKLLGVAKVAGYQLEFSKLSKKDGSGKAMPFATQRPNAIIHGALFEISKDQLRALDRAEGCGYGYDRIEDFSIYLGDDAEHVEATTYLANADFIDPCLQPFDWYLALVIAGAQQHDFPAEYINAIRRVNRVKDTRLERKGRADALEAFEKAGIGDFNSLF
ncbi:MAG: gamma-glutamylcyclotransferase [bacterium]|nr:gamma-glutamylcyclotransferase [bacterium]